MKLLGMILFAAALLVAGISAQPSTPDAFLSELRTAYEAKDLSKLESLTYFEGSSPQDKQMVALSLANLWGDGKIKRVSLTPLPVDFDNVRIFRGLKIEQTHPPTGFVRFDISGSESGYSSSKIPYARIDGKFFIVGTKTTDLGWKGPTDEMLGFFVSGTGAEKVIIEYSWNVSGVDQVKKVTSQSLSFSGQHFNWVTLTSDSPSANVALRLTKNGEDIFTSETLKGAGTLEYKKAN